MSVPHGRPKVLTLPSGDAIEASQGLSSVPHGRPKVLTLPSGNAIEVSQGLSSSQVVSLGRPSTARMSSWNSNQMLCTESSVGLHTNSR